MALLEVNNLRRSFGGLVALQQVSFVVNSGQIKAIIGPNGAGKTTLFNLICGLLKPEKGQITFRGQSLCGLEPTGLPGPGCRGPFRIPACFRA